jgi:hypothetical protein
MIVFNFLTQEGLQMKKEIINNLTSFFRKVLVISMVSSVVFAIQVNDEVELTQFMNARYSANFTKNAKNLRGTLSSGTKAKVVEIKQFKTGNLGFFLEVKSGRYNNENVWVHFNPNRPSLKLFSQTGAATPDPALATDATTTRDVPVIRDPATTPVSASTDTTLISIPSASGTTTVSGSTVVSATTVVDVVGAANRAVGGTSGGDSGCRDCTGPAPVGGSGNSGGPSDVVSGTTGVVPLTPVALAGGVIGNFFVDYDSIIDNASSLTAAQLAARRFLALRAHILNYSSFCERYTPGSDLINRVTTKWNGMSDFLIANDRVLGGSNPADVILTAYSNMASLKFSNLGPEAACQELKPQFEYFMRLNRAELSAYTSTPVNQRSRVIRSGVPQ